MVIFQTVSRYTPQILCTLNRNVGPRFARKTGIRLLRMAFSMLPKSYTLELNLLDFHSVLWTEKCLKTSQNSSRSYQHST